MTLGISFHEAAQREFDEATDFYAMERTSLGAAFVDGVERAVAHVHEHPESCIVLRGRVRKMRVARFPYAVLYSIVGNRGRAAGRRPRAVRRRASA